MARKKKKNSNSTNKAVNIESCYKVLGKNIAEARSEIDLTIDQVAAKMKCSRGSIYNVENGVQRVLVHQVPMLAKILKTTPGELLDGVY